VGGRRQCLHRSALRRRLCERCAGALGDDSRDGNLGTLSAALLRRGGSWSPRSGVDEQPGSDRDDRGSRSRLDPPAWNSRSSVGEPRRVLRRARVRGVHLLSRDGFVIPGGLSLPLRRPDRAAANRVPPHARTPPRGSTGMTPTEPSLASRVLVFQPALPHYRRSFFRRFGDRVTSLTLVHGAKPLHGECSVAPESLGHVRTIQVTHRVLGPALWMPALW